MVPPKSKNRQLRHRGKKSLERFFFSIKKSTKRHFKEPEMVDFVFSKSHQKKVSKSRKATFTRFGWAPKCSPKSNGILFTKKIEKRAQNATKMAPKLIPRGSRDALGAGLVLQAAFGHVFRRFSPPRNLNNLKKCCIVITCRGFRDSVHCAVGQPKKHPK